MFDFNKYWIKYLNTIGAPIIGEVKFIDSSLVEIGIVIYLPLNDNDSGTTTGRGICNHFNGVSV